MSDEVLAWLSIWSDVFAYGPALQLQLLPLPLYQLLVAPLKSKMV